MTPTPDEGFNLDNFVDAVTGQPAGEVVGEGGPGHYELSPKPAMVAGNIDMGSIDRPSVSGTLQMLMLTQQDTDKLSVSLPVGDLTTVVQLTQDLEQRCIDNGKAAAEKTRELVDLRDRFSNQENALRAVQNELALVWETIETWERGAGSKESPAYEAASRLRRVLSENLKPQERPTPFSPVTRPWPHNPEAITRVPTPEELVVGQNTPDAAEWQSMTPGPLMEIQPTMVFDPDVVHGAVMEKLEETDPFSEGNNELARDIVQAVRKVVVK